MRRINKVAVIGAGVMGATIAAHLANAGLEVLLLDILPKDAPDSGPERSSIAASGVKKLAKSKPAALFLKEYTGRIETGNLTDDADQLQTCDWVIEVVIERMDIKKMVFQNTILPNLKEDAIVSTNTSGLSVNDMADHFPPEVRKRFLVTHFFNPPRYMRLMEIVPCKETDPDVVTEMAAFLSKRLGKGVVFAKDTANFVANRIGVFTIYKAMELMQSMGLSIEEVDAIAGKATAKPKSAAFRTSDLVGIDTMVHVGNNSYENLPEDEQRETFKIPKFVTDMVEKGLLGDKSGQGFYKKSKDAEGKRVIQHYDWKTGEYADPTKPKFKSVGNARMEDDPSKRFKKLFEIDDVGSQFAWALTRDSLIYTYNRIPEIADDIINVDNAMKWGFNWEIGPFEMLDAFGVQKFCERAKADGVTLPDGLEAVESFYRYNEGVKEYWDILEKAYKPFPINPHEINLEIITKAGGTIMKNADCSLLDLGDGVFGLEFHSKMNTIGGGILGMTTKAVEYTEKNGVGMVVGNQGASFSAGANLMLLTMAISEGEFDDVALMIRSFQRATMALKYSKVPVVSAPFHLTLGGGCEFSLHADAINAYAETWMGLVELGVGLLPAGGGTKEMAIRSIDLAIANKTDVSPFIFERFQNIGLAKVSTSADELFKMNYMREGDSVTMNLDHLIQDAKQKVLALATNYRPKSKRVNLPAPGRSVAASIQSQLWNMVQGGFATEYEYVLGSAVARVITGGDVAAGTLITEDWLLELEMQEFLKLTGNRKTFERIQHTLKTGKPLRN